MDKLDKKIEKEVDMFLEKHKGLRIDYKFIND